MPNSSVKSTNRPTNRPVNKVTFYLISVFGNRTRKTLNRNNVKNATMEYNKIPNFKINGHNVYKEKSSQRFQ